MDLAQVGLHRGLHGFRDLIEHVAGLVQPAALVSRAGIELVERLPEAKGAVADRNFGRDGKAAALHLDQEFAPALGALPDTDLEPDEFLPALGRRANQHQHALGMLLHPGVQVDAIRPDVEVAPCREVAPLPMFVLGLPFGRQPGDDRRRQVRRVPAEQRRERLLEVARRDPAQVEDRQQRIEAPGPASPLRQDRRGEADPLLITHRAAVPDLHTRDRDGADASLDHPLGAMAVPYKAITPVRQLQLPHAGQEGIGFKLDRLREEPPGAGPQHIRQGIVDLVGLPKADYVGRRVHGVSLSLRGSGRLDTRLDTPPSHRRRHPHSVIARVPGHVRSDNSPEFVAKAVQAWITAVGAKTAYIAPGSPWGNGYVDSFNARLRDELLDGEVFYSLREAQIIIESWRRHYNTVRPHASLGYRPPAPEVFVPAFAAWQAAPPRPAPPAMLPVAQRPTLN